MEWELKFHEIIFGFYAKEHLLSLEANHRSMFRCAILNLARSNVL